MLIKQAIPTNVITGFLGAGKSTAIRYLLMNKPKHERWAVLVNEFGDVGVDGVLIEEGQASEQEVFVREVPGGCMCCAAGAPMRVALNQLLKQSRPHRLLIEPTGLGHPKEILRVLQQKSYQGILSVCATLTLLDARNINNALYCENQIFLDQLSVADILVANKHDLYAPDDLSRLATFLHERHLGDLSIQVVSQGEINSTWLDQLSRSNNACEAMPMSLVFDEQLSLVDRDALPDCGYMRRDHVIEGFASSGWIFDARYRFNLEEIQGILNDVNALRVKAVVVTEQGMFSYNRVDSLAHVEPIARLDESRIEVIGASLEAWSDLHRILIHVVS